MASHFHKCSVPLFPLSLFLFNAGENERKNRSFCGPSNIQSIESTLLVSKRLFSWTYHYCTIHWYLHIPTQIRSSPCFIKVTKTWDNQNKKKLKQQCWVFFFKKIKLDFDQVESSSSATLNQPWSLMNEANRTICHRQKVITKMENKTNT